MKRCRKYQAPIAWLALNLLDEPQARGVRAHLETCAGCRRSFEEMRRIVAGISAAELPADAGVSPGFHRRLAARLKAAKLASAGEGWAASLRAAWLTPRLVLPALGVAALVLVATFQFAPRWLASPNCPPEPRPSPGLRPEPARLPTLASYLGAVRQSPEKLDELLARQAGLPVPSAPNYRAWAFGLAGGAD